MKIRFDQSLLALIEVLLKNDVTLDEVRKAVFLRDSTGRLSVVFRDSLAPNRKNQLEHAIREALGGYARPDALLRDYEDVGAARLLNEFAPKIFVENSEITLIDRRIVGADWLLQPKPSTGIPRIAFSSIKGGAGRSTALAVMASYLSSRGLRVLAVDLDLEAPGIGSMLIEPEALPKYGTLDYLVENGISGVDDAFIRDMMGKSFLGASGAQVTVIPAIGTETLSNPSGALSKIARAYVEDIDDSGQAKALTDQVRELIDSFSTSGDYDIVLIDGRAGLHETTAAVLLGLGAEVLFFGVDEPQTFVGYKLLLSHIAQYSGENYSNWWTRIQFVHAKSSAEAHLKRKAEERFAELLVELHRNPNAALPEKTDRLTEDVFDMQWVDIAVESHLVDIAGDVADENVPVIHILDDDRYREFDPLADRTVLSSDIFLSTFSELIEWIKILVPQLRDDDDVD